MSEKCLTLLVHGVGNHEPGQMIEAVEKAFRSVDRALPQVDEYAVVYLEDEAPLHSKYPMYTRTFRLDDDNEVLFGEVYWADLSRIRGGTLDLLIGAFRLIFGLRYVSDIAGHQRDSMALLLRRLLYLAIFVIRTLQLAVLMLGVAFCMPCVVQGVARLLNFPDLAWLSDSGSYYAVGAAVIVTGAAAVIANAIPSCSYKLRVPVRNFCLWLCSISLFVTISVHWPWFQSLLNAHFPKLPHDDVRGYLFATIIVLTAWSRDIAGACMGLALITLVPAIIWARAQRKPGLAIAYCSAALQLVLWQLALAPLYVAINVVMATVMGQIDPEIVHFAISYIGARILVMYSLIAVIFLIWRVRISWAKAHQDDGAWPPAFPPRLILGIPAQAWLFIASIVLISFSLLTAPNDVLPRKFPLPDSLVAFLRVINEPVKGALFVAWPITIAVFGYLVVSEGTVQNGLHVVADVINHFFRPEERFPVKRQIEARFRRVFTRLVGQYQPTRVLIIAHSQGTVITFNALARLCSGCRPEIAAMRQRIDVVTLGSPLTHLYQHYFPRRYPISGRRLSILKQFVRNWRNIFRTDDFVGTFISFGSDHPQTQAWPKNIAAEPGGHTHYWKCDIFKHLTDLIP